MLPDGWESGACFDDDQCFHGYWVFVVCQGRVFWEDIEEAVNKALFVFPLPDPLGNCSCVALLTYIHVGIP